MKIHLTRESSAAAYLVGFALVFATFLFAGPATASAASILDPFTPTELANEWVTDRYEPTGGRTSVTAFGRDDVAQLGIDSMDTQPLLFQRTEGIRQVDNFGQEVSVDLYIDPDWKNKAVRAGFWVADDDGTNVPIGTLPQGTGWNAFGIIEFINSEPCTEKNFNAPAADPGCSNQGNITDHEGFRIWDNNNGWKANLDTPFTYGTWVTLTIKLNTADMEYNYYIDGNLVGTATAGDQFIREVFLNSYNYGADVFPDLNSADYQAHWHNGFEPASLTLEKEVVNDNDGQATEDQFTLTATGLKVTIEGIEGDPEVTDAWVPIGTYALSESGPAGYTGTWACEDDQQVEVPVSNDEITLTEGQIVTCTVTNDDIPPTPQYTVTILKYIDGAPAQEGGPFPMESTWTAANLNDGNETSGNFTLEAPDYSATTSPMDQGASYVTEELLDGDNVGATCADGKPYALVGYTQSGSIAGAEKKDKTDSAGFANLNSNKYIIVWNESCVTKLTIIKTVVDGLSQPDDFTIEVSDASGIVKTDQGAGDPGVMYTDLDAGDYTVTETNPGPYTPTYGGACDADGNVTLVTGEESICTISNALSPDTTPPIVTITNPADGDVVSGVVDVRGTLEEDVAMGNWNAAIYPAALGFGNPADRIEQNNVNPSPDDNFTDQTIFTWDTTNGLYPDGDYLVRFAARDAAGNTDQTGDPLAGGDDSQHVIEVTVDNVPDDYTVKVFKYFYDINGPGDFVPDSERPADAGGPFMTSDGALEQANGYMYEVTVPGGADYTTAEVFDDIAVSATCAGGAPYEFGGYSWGDGLVPDPTAAKTRPVNIEDVQNDKWVIVWNRPCPDVPTHDVKVIKYIVDGRWKAPAMDKADDDDIFQTTYRIDGAPQAGIDEVLNDANDFMYTVAVPEGSAYVVREQADGQTVGSSCAAGAKYERLGYTNGNTEKAAMRKYPGAIDDKKGRVGNITRDKVIIIWNKKCPEPATLKLKKIVDNSDGGSTGADEWELSATSYGSGASSISGYGTPTAGTPPYEAVLGPQAVTPGLYYLSETTNSPEADDYKASKWQCSGANVWEKKNYWGKTSSMIYVKPGAHVECWITNTYEKNLCEDWKVDDYKGQISELKRDFAGKVRDMRGKHRVWRDSGRWGYWYFDRRAYFQDYWNTLNWYREELHVLVDALEEAEAHCYSGGYDWYDWGKQHKHYGVPYGNGHSQW